MITAIIGITESPSSSANGDDDDDYRDGIDDDYSYAVAPLVTAAVTYDTLHPRCTTLRLRTLEQQKGTSNSKR